MRRRRARTSGAGTATVRTRHRRPPYAAVVRAGVVAAVPGGLGRRRRRGRVSAVRGLLRRRARRRARGRRARGRRARRPPPGRCCSRAFRRRRARCDRGASSPPLLRPGPCRGRRWPTTAGLATPASPRTTPRAARAPRRSPGPSRGSAPQPSPGRSAPRARRPSRGGSALIQCRTAASTSPAQMWHSVEACACRPRRETTGENAREGTPILRGSVRAQDRQRLAPLGQRTGLDEGAEIVRDDRGRDAHVRARDVRRDVRGASLLPEFGAARVREDEGVRVAPGGDARGDGAAVVADDERALDRGVGGVHDLRRLVRRRRHRRRARLGGFTRGNHLGRLGDGGGRRRGGRRGRGFGDPAVRVHLVEKVHAVVHGRGRGEAREAPPAPRGGR